MATVSPQNMPLDRTRRPQVPTPQSSSARVRAFLVQFFLCLDDTMTATEAEEKAKAPKTDGKGLYQISLERWVELFGIQGQTIFDELQESIYGHYRWAAIGQFFPWLESSVASSSSSPDPSSFSKENLFIKVSFLSLLPSSRPPSSSSTTCADPVSSSTAQDSQETKRNKFDLEKKLLRVIGTPQCWWCGQAEQSVEHLYTKCRKWKKERQKFLRNLYKEGIRWQGWTERKGLAELLANEKALGPLVKIN